jgi:hypothetical protein
MKCLFSFKLVADVVMVRICWRQSGMPSAAITSRMSIVNQQHPLLGVSLDTLLDLPQLITLLSSKA